MKIYLASRYGRRLQMQDFRHRLQMRGHTVTSRWIDGEHEGKEGNGAHGENRRFAQEDLEDIDKADTVILFSEIDHKDAIGRSRGGKHVELGYALGTKKPIAVVGSHENIFYHLVDNCDSIWEAVAVLQEKLVPKQKVLYESQCQCGAPIRVHVPFGTCVGCGVPFYLNTQAEHKPVSQEKTITEKYEK